MSARANPGRIGVFVVGAVILLVTSLVVFGSGRFFKKADLYVAYFEGSVAGLTVGAPVTFQGVPIGSVTDIQVRLYSQQKLALIPTYFEVIPDRFQLMEEQQGTQRERINASIGKGLRAQLVSQSFVTGQLAIEINLKPDTPVRLVGADPNVIEIPTTPSTVQKLMSELQNLNLEQLVASANTLLNDIDALVTSPAAKDLLAEVLKLADNANVLITNLDAEVRPTAASLRDATGAATEMLNQGRGTIARLDTALVPAVVDAHGLVRNLAAAVPKIEALLAAALANAEETLRPDSPLMRDLRRALTEFASASRSVRTLADEIERNPSVLVRGK